MIDLSCDRERNVSTREDWCTSVEMTDLHQLTPASCSEQLPLILAMRSGLFPEKKTMTHRIQPLP